MALDIVCPHCGETDDLAGTRDGELIHIACGSCGLGSVSYTHLTLPTTPYV